MSVLAELFTTWRAAQDPQLSVRRVPWPQLEQLVSVTAGRLRPYADMSSTASQVLSAVFGARQLLTCTPLPPVHELAGLISLHSIIDAFLTDHRDHTVHEPLRAVLAAIEDLLGTDSPVAAELAAVLCEYGETPDGTPEALLVVPRRLWVEPVKEWLAGEELDCVAVATPSDLRTSPVIYEAAVIVGHPATAFTSAFKAPDVAVRENGWLLTAPSAKAVRLVLPADAPTLRPSDLWLLPEGASPTLTITDDGPRRTQPVPHDWAHVSEPASTHRTPRPPVTDTAEEIRAVEVQIASGHGLFFHNEVGPRPHLVAVDDDTGAVALSTVAVSAVIPGTVIALRVGAAPHEQVVARADAWLQRRREWPPKRIAEVRGCAAQLKHALRDALAHRGHATLHTQLSRTLSENYARVLLHNPLDEDYIAPQREAAFNALVRVVDADQLLGRFGDLATVRTAHQQAGEEIRRSLLELLSDRAWVGEIDDDGWAVLRAGDLGTLLLAVVTARLDESVSVPRTWLGVPVNRAGRRVTALEAKE